MKKFISILICLFCMGNITIQAQTKVEGHWGMPYLNQLYSSAATNDGGYILTGLTKNGVNDAYGDILVIKLDHNADTQWTWTYGGPLLEGGNCVISTSDGGYMVSGHTQDFGSEDCDGFLLKLDSAGNRQWLKHCGGIHDDIAEGTIQLSDGGYIYAGITESFNPDTSDVTRHIYFVRSDSMGDTMWTKHYNFGGTAEYGYDIAAIPTGGFYAVGYSNSFGSGEKDGWLFRLDNNGNMLWKKLFKSDTGDTKLYKIIPTSDNGYILTGGTNQPLGSNSIVPNSSQGIVIKIDSAGNILWQKTFGHTIDGIEFRSVTQLSSGNLLFAGSSFVYDSTGNVYIVSTDINGNILSDQYCGGIASDAQSICSHSNGSFLISGYSAQYGNTYGDAYWMAMVYANACVKSLTTPAALFYPNPTTNMATIQLPYPHQSDNVSLEIVSATGQLLLKKLDISAKDLKIDCTGLASGVYVYRINCTDGTKFNGRFTVE